MNSGIYGKRFGTRYGLIHSASKVTDGAACTIAEMGQILIDDTTGEIYYVDDSGLSQVLS